MLIIKQRSFVPNHVIWIWPDVFIMQVIYDVIIFINNKTDEGKLWYETEIYLSFLD